MPKPNISQLFSLPFLQSYSTGTRKFITISKVHNFLGYNFYSRLNSIYENLINAFSKKNYRYLETSFQNTLLLKYMKDMKFVQDGRYKFKVHHPDTRLSIKKLANRNKLKKLLPLRDTVWDDGVTKIGLQCNVYFGDKFNREDPLKKLEDTTVSKLYRIGEFRYIRYYKHLSLFQNLQNMYKQQTYQLLVKYSSKLYLQIQNYDEITTKQSNLINSAPQIESKQIMTQLIMRTGHQKFDWIIIDINDVNKEFRNHNNVPVGAGQHRQPTGQKNNKEQNSIKMENIGNREENK